MRGTGDFDRDGDADILWRNENTGAVHTLLVEDGRFQSWTSAGQLGLEWQVSGVGDYDGDSDADILWENLATGNVGALMIEGGQAAGFSPIEQLVNDWQLV